MKIIFRKAARDDLDAVFEYIDTNDPHAALRLLETIRQRISMLAQYPSIGRAGRVVDTRELVISGTPYLVAYTVDHRLDAVIILRVIHGRREWPEEFE